MTSTVSGKARIAQLKDIKTSHIEDSTSEKPIEYCWRDEVSLAVRVALATGRALLLQGEPGIGKTLVAEAVAELLGWRFYRHPVSSRTEVQDLTWRFDQLRRLGDAQAKNLDKDERAYLTPGPFWWALDPDLASRRGREKADVDRLKDPGRRAGAAGAVVLVDEIDKADPAVANDLLETVGARRFLVDGLADPFTVEYRPEKEGGLLIVFTSNGERDLPAAFLRRCIVQSMSWPDSKGQENAKAAFNPWLRDVANRNWGRLGKGPPEAADSTGGPELLEGLIDLIWAQRAEHLRQEIRPPGVAEFLDAIAACRTLGVTPKTPEWAELMQLVWTKQGL